jgi:transketolase
VAYSKKNVKICASHAGLTLGEDGATHQVLEDIGMMRMLPNMTVIVPADFNQTKQATIAIAAHEGPVYLRFGRPVMPIFVKPDAEFVIGKADVLAGGTDVTIIACGHMVWKSIEALKELRAIGISVELINMHTIKPLDAAAILKSVGKTGCVVTAEEHMMNGGLGEAVSQVLSRQYPVPQEYVAVNDTFGESGTPMELMTKYHIDTPDVVAAAKRAIARKSIII